MSSIGDGNPGVLGPKPPVHMSCLVFGAMETYAVRLWLPDRPGALGAVASRVGAVRGSVVGIEILETGEGMAIDELVVQLPQAALVDLLVDEVEEVDGVKVEEVRSLGQDVHDPRLDALETAARLVGATDPEELLGSLCELAGESLGSEWIAVVELEGGEVRHGSGAVPPAAWLRAFLDGSRAESGSGAAVERNTDDVVWAPLPGAGLAVVAGRDGSPYRARERRQLNALARIVDAWFRDLTRRLHPSSASRRFADEL